MRLAGSRAVAFWALLSRCSEAAAEERPGGCGTTPLPGGTSSQTLAFGGRDREFQVRVPAQYDPAALTPLVLYFHGWGGSGNVGWMSSDADANTYIAVAPTGVGRGNNPDGGSNSWNGGGSTTSPGPQGPSCAPGSPEYCYDSCAARPQGCHPCDWTTCTDDFAFVDGLLDWLEANLCVDPARIYATGHSNGGQFAWALASRLASGRLAAIAPSAGTPHTGFGEAPPPEIGPVSVMDVHGINDNTCPANSTEPSNDGWYYEQVPIMCEIFSSADGCDPEYLEHYPTSFDHQSQLCECITVDSRNHHHHPPPPPPPPLPPLRQDGHVLAGWLAVHCVASPCLAERADGPCLYGCGWLVGWLVGCRLRAAGSLRG
jgi:poly(3-hydroxybutyrate) depolymerase